MNINNKAAGYGDIQAALKFFSKHNINLINVCLKVVLYGLVPCVIVLG